MCAGVFSADRAIFTQAAKSLKKGQRCVVLLPDSVRNYMSKFLSDGWMVDNKSAHLLHVVGCGWERITRNLMSLGRFEKTEILTSTGGLLAGTQEIEWWQKK